MPFGEPQASQYTAGNQALVDEHCRVLLGHTTVSHSALNEILC
jgi:hypothetical protein